MKKEEAQIVAIKRAKLLMEYITQILSDSEKVECEILIDSAKINNERMCTFEIFVPKKQFEKHLDTNISSQHCDILNEQILEQLIENFLDSEQIAISKYYQIRGGYGMNIDGINISNRLGSIIKLNFVCRGNLFDNQVKKYNEILMNYIEEQQNNQKIK